MLSSRLNSGKAIEANIAIIRTFVLIRQHVPEYREFQEKLLKLEKRYNKNFREIYTAFNFLINDKIAQGEQKNRRRIGFKTNNDDSL